MVMVHSSLAERFVETFKTSVNKLGFGLPWEANVKITPLPEKNKIIRMKELIQDAVSKVDNNTVLNNIINYKN